ncbi:MAG: hypothetical protein L0Z50_39135 [Verrucomicrobiales bacterium]|nr:hypothetical protein [Verrucomicrobiales bacterium]
MARKLRVQLSGGDHVMNRGDRREPIFKDDEDRRRFLETLGEGVREDERAGACLLLDARSGVFPQLVEGFR